MFTAEALRGPLRWLLDLTWAGKTTRYAAERTWATVDGAELEYVPGLHWQRSTDSRLTPYGGAPAGVSASVTIHPIMAGLSMPELVAEGHNPGAARAVLRLYAVATDEARIVVQGRLRDPQWGAADEPLVATLESIPAPDERGSFWRRSNRVLASTFPDTDSQASMEYYPIVVGSPAGYTDSGHTPFSGSPGLLVDETGGSETVLLSMGHTVAGTNGDSVYLSNYGAGSSGNLTAANDYDNDGFPVTIADASSPGGGTAPVDGDELWVAWRSATNVRTYGIAGPNNAPIRGLGDVILWALRRSTVSHDEGRIAGQLARLNHYAVDTYVQRSPDRDVIPYEWIAGTVLRHLPWSPHVGAHGLYYLPWRYDATTDEALVALDTDTNAQRTGLVQLSGLDDVRSRVDVSYRYNPRTSRFRSTLELTGEDDDPAADRSAPLAGAFATYGGMGSFEAPLHAIQDQVAAAAAARALARRHGAQRRRIGYLVEQYPGGLVGPGDIVTITDAELDLTSAVAVVVEAQWTEDTTREVVIELN